MRRIYAVTLIILAMPMALMAMTPLDDSDLSEINAQSGININPDLTMDISIDTIAWGDSDGINPSCGVNPWPSEGLNGGGYVGFNDFKLTNLRIRMRDNDTYNGYNTLMARPMTIDVATGYKPFSGYGENTTFVRISPGAMKISMDQMQFEVALGPRSSSGPAEAPVLTQKLGVATLGAMETYVNPRSYVDVYAHSATGVTFDVNLTLDRVNFQYLSWGSRSN